MSGLSGRFEKGEHVLPVRVYYEDTDAAGIVYYANYLKYAERARTELLRLAGIRQSDVSREHCMAFAVCDCQVDYQSPARLDDLVEVRSRLVVLRAARGRTGVHPRRRDACQARRARRLRQQGRPAGAHAGADTPCIGNLLST